MTSPQATLGASASRSDTRVAWMLIAPAIVIVLAVAVFPILWTLWESLHLHDLRMPWLGRPLVGVGNYLEVLFDRRFVVALAHTLSFVAITVPLELAAGLAVAVALDRSTAARQLVRTVVLLPWAIPTVVAALIWRFIFESPAGIATRVIAAAGLAPPTWFADPVAAWLPIVVADVWKATPFVVILLLAGLQNIDRALYEAADVDGAGPWRVLVEITLPLLAPALAVAFLFRALDALRVFDIIYVMTGGGPGTATEPIALYTFSTLMQNLRFGYGAALSIVVFLLSFVFALATIRAIGGTPGDRTA